ncbi:MAG: hypothetical protein QM662_17930 [Gordonia sp. (in: high G+C Gram-positive bacteria)]
MGSEVWIALIAAAGSSGLAGAIVAWLKGRNRENAELTQVLRQMSKEAVVEAKSELADIKADLREVKEILAELVRTVEQEVIPLLPDQPDLRDHLHLVSQRAKKIV